MLSTWLPFFDPYSTCIDRIDQWVRVPRLLWEFWEHDTLVGLLKPVDNVIKMDQTTLLRLKGKFARVCVNIDVTEPLPRSLVISYKGKSMKVTLIYEDLHEVCALCGSDSHQIDSCPDLPLQTKVEIVVQKFGEAKVKAPVNEVPINSCNDPMTFADQWIRVSPKKRSRTMSSSYLGNKSSLKASPFPKFSIMEPGSSSSDPVIPPLHSPGHPHAKEPNLLEHTPPLLSPALILAHTSQIISHDLLLNEDPLNAMDDEQLATPSENLDDDSQEFMMNEEDMADTFMNLEPMQELELSTESSKMRRVEEGEEGLSQAPN